MVSNPIANINVEAECVQPVVLADCRVLKSLLNQIIRKEEMELCQGDAQNLKQTKLAMLVQKKLKYRF